MAKDKEKEIYQSQAERYEQLIAREDYQQNILPALNIIRPLDNHDLEVVEFGAGTGRLTCMLAPLVRHIRAFDAAQAMLDVAAAKLKQTDLQNWELAVADNRDLPIEDQTADITISGWSICYTVTWHADGWQTELDKALSEMERILRPGGTLIILETQGTGHETPQPPENLLKYYDYLEEDQGFSATWIRTDYRFQSPQEAESLTRFFFGDQLADQVAADKLIILPECTGIWWRTKA